MILLTYSTVPVSGPCHVPSHSQSRQGKRQSKRHPKQNETFPLFLYEFSRVVPLRGPEIRRSLSEKRPIYSRSVDLPSQSVLYQTTEGHSFPILRDRVTRDLYESVRSLPVIT